MLDFFIAGTIARMAAKVVGVNQKNAVNFYERLRRVIAFYLEKDSPFLDGEIAADESYFGGGRFGKRGRSVVGKVAVFGLRAASCVAPGGKTLSRFLSSGFLPQIEGLKILFASRCLFLDCRVALRAPRNDGLEVSCECVCASRNDGFGINDAHGEFF